MSALLEIKNLTVGFYAKQGFLPAVKNINLNIQKGETLALVGESGGGKTITSLAIMQLLPVSAYVTQDSKILLQQQDLLNLSEIKMRKIRGRRIGMVFQEALIALNPVLTIGHQIEEVLRCHFSLKKSARQKKILSLLDEVGIQNPKQCAQSYPHQLSGGMRQRAMIAMALAGEPELLIADEPTTALDVTIQAQVLQLLKQLQQKRNMAMLFITHDLGIVAQMANHVAVIYQGEIIEQADVKTFFANPRHDYTKKLFAALPNIQKRLRPPVTFVSEKPLLNVNDLKTYFPIQKGIFKRVVGHIKAVDGVSFALYQGQTLALVGESGSGKTTVGKSILRLLKPTSGTVNYQDINLLELNSEKMRLLRRELQIVFQDPYSSMDPRMMIGDILEEGMISENIGSKESRAARIDELLQLVGLAKESKFRYPHEFSGGQRQRICIARSLALDPKIIVCDEPTSALDVSTQMQILQLLEQLQIKFGIAYLLITHNFSVVSYLADEVAVMYQGRLVEQGKVEEILKNPQHVYTKKLLSAIPKIPEQVEYREYS